MKSNSNQHFWLFQLCSNFTCVWFDNSSSIRVALWIGVGVCWGWGRGGGSREVGGGGSRGTRFAHTRGGGTSFQRSPSLLIEDQQCCIAFNVQYGQHKTCVGLHYLRWIIMQFSSQVTYLQYFYVYWSDLSALLKK